jgi:hypothetical protein
MLDHTINKTAFWSAIVLILAAVSFSAHAAPEFLPPNTDEFVLVLDGAVTLTNVDGGTQTYKHGDTFLVPKGWMGTWDMPVKYREMIVIETDALLAGEL